MAHNVIHQNEYVRVLRKWKDAEETIKNMENQERADISRIKELQDQIKAIRDWYQQNRKDAIPYQRTPTKWDRLSMILESSLFKEDSD